MWWSMTPRHTPRNHRRPAYVPRASVSYMAITIWASLRLQPSSTLRNWRSSRTAAYSVITEGVFGMKGDLGKTGRASAMKKDSQLPPVSLMTPTAWHDGSPRTGTAAHFGVGDVWMCCFNTFAKVDGRHRSLLSAVPAGLSTRCATTCVVRALRQVALMPMGIRAL